MPGVQARSRRALRDLDQLPGLEVRGAFVGKLLAFGVRQDLRVRRGDLGLGLRNFDDAHGDQASGEIQVRKGWASSRARQNSRTNQRIEAVSGS